ncbi:hypothetical protein [Pseudoruegeria sp. HB172150]|uniref:hypothetical protein n=1 Tax=Pseudoruegeria sp. HB172150 TaxID=2721164 RepID=UPI0020A64D71|nr:hypothetical protein [Pseudoruegeria sp. HB172150]
MKQTTLLIAALALAGCGGGANTAGDTGLFGGGATGPAGEPLSAIDPATTNLEAPEEIQEGIISDAELSAVTNAPPPSADARTVEDYDTTTPEQREAAAAPAPVITSPPATTTTTETTTAAPEAAGDGRLGTTVASIGSPEEPGFWIKTPLVSENASGRLFYPASGRTVQVQLIPSGGASGSGSQVSLAALRLLDAPLDGLPELVVYRN